MFLQRCITSDCRAEYKLDERLYVCSRCGGLLEIDRTEDIAVDAASLNKLWRTRRSSSDIADRSGVWRFREFLPFEEDDRVVSLGEGNTPLFDAPRSARYCHLPQLKLKHQGCNPTGSFKDTGMTTAVSQARKLGARVVVCASTGNTSASLAAYAARADLLCAIIVPSGQVSHAKLAQALDYGAKVLEIEGNFDTCMNTIRELAEHIKKLVGSASRIEYVPYESYYPKGFEDTRRRVPSTALARELLGFEARVGLEDGLSRTIDWCRANYGL